MASDVEKLFITYVVQRRDLLEIWGQKNRSMGMAVDQKLSDLEAEFEHSSAPRPDRIYLNMRCFAKYKDQSFYRARVISEVQGTLVRVHFVDFGNKDYVDITDIRADAHFVTVFERVDDLAEPFILANVVAPIGGWGKEIIAQLKRELCYEEVPCRVLDASENLPIIQILFENQNLSLSLVNRKVAREVSLEVQKSIMVSYQTQFGTDRQNNLSIPNVPPGMVRPSSTNFQQPKQMPSERPGLINLVTKQGAFQPGPEHQAPQRLPRVPNNPVPIPMNVPPPNVPVSSNSLYSPPFNPAQIQDPNLPFNGTPSPLVHQFNPLQQMNPMSPLMNSAVIEALASQIRQQIVDDTLKTKKETPPSPAAQPFDQPVLEVGSAHNVYVTYVEDGPWAFSIQLCEDQNQYDKLMSRISSMKRVPIKRPITLGRPCVAKSVKLNMLFRGVVVNVAHKSIRVYYVDTGMNEDIPVDNVFEAPLEYIQIKAFSYRFALCGLQKVPYSPDIKEVFKEATPPNQIIMLRVTSLEGESLPTCELYLERLEGGEQKNVNVKRILNESLKLLRNMVAEPYPDVGATEKVVVTYVESPLKFYVQLKRRDNELQNLKDELARLSPMSQPLSPDQLKIGQACVCLYSEDEQWYRAVITSFNSEQSIDVFYVDYGNADTVALSALRKMDLGIISKMNTQALRCSLQEFISRPIDDEISDRLSDMITDKTVDLKVIKHDKEYMIVKLFLNNADVSQELLKPPIPVPTTPREPAYTPQVKTPVQEDPSDWGESNAEQQPDFGGNRPFNRSDDRNRYNRPRRFNENEDDSQNKSFDRARGGFGRDDRNDFNKGHEDSDDRNKRSRFGDRGSQRQEEPTTDWGDTGKSSNDFSNRNQRSENNFNDRGGERRRFNDRGNFGDKKEGGDDAWGSSDNYGSKQREDRDFGERKKFGGRDRDGDGNKGDWGSKSGNDWGNKERNDSGGGRRFGNKDGDDDNKDDWGSKPNNDFPDRKRFDNKDGDDKDKFAKKFADRPPRYPVRRNDAAPEGSKWTDEYIDNGSIHRTIVTYIVNPHDFYVQMLDNKEEFETMMKEIQTYYSDRFWCRELPNVGEICIAKFSEDRVLYRAVVTDSSPFTVQYIDYGNSGKVHPKDVYVVDKKFMDLPKQSVKCKLNIAPLEDSWPEAGGPIDKFFERDEFNCHFVNHLTDDTDIFEVKLESNGQDVAQEIIAAGLARPLAGGAAAVSATTEAAADSTHVPVLDLSLLVNQTFNFYISYIESLSKFYVLMYPTNQEIIQGKVDAFVQDEKNFVQLARENFEVGRMCISTNNADDLWFRAKMLIVTDTGAIVQFVDYGDCAEVTDDQILIISDELAQYPGQAIECSLYGATDDINQSVHDEFKNSYETMELICFVNSLTDNRLILSLYDAEGNKLEFVKDINDSPASIEPLTAPRIAHQRTPVFISHYDSPSEIFVQRQCDAEPIETLSATLNEFYEASGEDFDPALPENESKLCAGKSVELESWYRCRLISAADDKAFVQYIDYGNSEELPFANLKKLDAQFFTSCCLAKKVSLYADFPEEKLDDAVNKIQEVLMDKELMAFFKVLDGVTYAEFQESGVRFTDSLISEGLCTRKEDIFEGFEFTVAEVAKTPEVAAPAEEVVQEQPAIEGEGEIIFITHQDSCYDFYVQKNSDSEQINIITEALVNAAEFEDVPVVKTGEMYAALYPSDEQWYRATVEKSNDVMEAFFVDFGNKSVVTEVKKLPDNLAEVPTFAHRCELAYPENGCDWTQGECFNKFLEFVGKELQMVVLLENENKKFVNLFDGENSVADLIKEPSENLLPEITIVHVNSLSDLYVQYSDEAEKLDQIAELIADVENFENLEDKTVGAKCIAKFPEDELWYRAVIVTDSGDSCDVEFIDYGNVANVTELKKSNEEIDAIEKVAHHCALSGATGSEPEAIKTEFSEFVADPNNLFATDFSPRQSDTVRKIRIFWKGVDYGKYLLGKKTDDVGEVGQGEVVETDDDKIRVQVVTANETDEEKSVKARQSTEGTSEGFKSDDEKTVPSVIVNVPDNELIGQEEELDDSVQIIEVVEPSQTPLAELTETSVMELPQTPMSDTTEYLEIKAGEDVLTDDCYTSKSEASAIDSGALDKSQSSADAYVSKTDSSVWEKSQSNYVPRPEASPVDSRAWDKSKSSADTQVSSDSSVWEKSQPDYEPRPDVSPVDSRAWDKSKSSADTHVSSDSSVWEKSESDYAPRSEASPVDSSAWDKSQNILKDGDKTPTNVTPEVSDAEEERTPEPSDGEVEDKMLDALDYTPTDVADETESEIKEICNLPTALPSEKSDVAGERKGDPTPTDFTSDESEPMQEREGDPTPTDFTSDENEPVKPSGPNFPSAEEDSNSSEEKESDPTPAGGRGPLSDSTRTSESDTKNIEKGEQIPEESECDESPERDLNIKKEPEDDSSKTGGKSFLQLRTIKQEATDEPEPETEKTTSHINGVDHHTSEESISPVIKKETETKTEDCSPIAKDEMKFKPEVVGSSLTLPRKSSLKSRRNLECKIVPGSISRGISNEELNTSTPIPKTPHSEKLVPGSISRGISYEIEYSDSQDDETAERSSVSAPVTPSPGRKNYKKVSHQDKIIPGCVAGSELEVTTSPVYEKKPRSEQIIPGVVAGASNQD